MDGGTGKVKKIRISQCMIVKNEEKNIERALLWGKDIMWEQIVVDTGSTDRTVELAESLGAKVFHFEWIDDFAAAKNFAIDQAKGDWIAFLDADEYMNADDAKKLEQLLGKIEKLPYLALLTDWLNLNEAGEVFRGGSQMRFFRNGRGIHYAGRIHESLEKKGAPWKAEDFLDGCGELRIFHTGYTDEALVSGDKIERNKKLILKELEERPEDYAMMGNLADVYRAMGEFDLAIEWYERSNRQFLIQEPDWQGMNERMITNYSCLLNLLCAEKKDRAWILRTYEEAVREFPQESDFDYLVGMYLTGQNEWKQAASHLERALKILEQNSLVCQGMMLTADLPRVWEYLAMAYFNDGQKENCVNTCVAFLKEERFSMGILLILLTVFGREAGAGQVLDFLGKLYDLSNLKERLFVLKAAKEIGYEGLVQELRPFFSPQELEALKSIEI